MALPIVGGDQDAWGDKLNSHLTQMQGDIDTTAQNAASAKTDAANAASTANTAISTANNASTRADQVATDLGAHESKSLDVHGIADTSLLETQSGAQAKVDAHLNDTTAHQASAITFYSGGGIAATDVQAALAELDTDKSNVGHAHPSTDLSDSTAVGRSLVTATDATAARSAIAAVSQDDTDARYTTSVTNLVTNPSGEATTGTVEVRRNLATNPSGQSDQGWLSNNSTQLPVTWDTTIFRSGSRSRRSELAAGQTSNACLSLYAVGDSSGAILPITAGETYTFSCYVRPGQAGYYSEARIYWYDASGVEVTPRPTVTTAELPPGEWTRVSVSGTAPVGATGRRNGLLLRAVSGNATPGDFGHAEDALFEKSPVLGDYFDGSYSPDPDLTPEWTGTANASESRLVGPAPVGWAGAYYSTSRDRIAALSSGATYTLAADPGPATLVVETETDTLHSPHTGTVVTVNEPYFRAAVIAGDYTGPYFDGDTLRAEWNGPAHAATSTWHRMIPDSPGAPLVASSTARPDAAAVGVGGHVFDTTLNKPIWSDGTNWRDASGTIV